MKNFLFAVILIIFIALVFVFFSNDINSKNLRFLSSFGIKADPSFVSFEEIIIPKEFDSVYEEYNFLQIQAGFDLLEYRGSTAVRYTYKVLNFPQGSGDTVYANVISLSGKPIGGDICCPAIDGFMLPLNYLRSNSDSL